MFNYFLKVFGYYHHPYNNIIFSQFNLNWYFLHHNYSEETSIIININNLFFKIRSYLKLR
ncbi:unnamed protein product, partial [Vitis vinifera]